ncbi:hypothetical protein LUZ61_013829 [Rhynchospora tenuis]|uniref:SWIM-type domain-containing protein n=1 Tax=Rhynchospora tenuis TaxID=198213 RepID=A0AAD5Z0K4_9POAL|nr:hypothetical protein LUZ61_013829 [Rhynchospora tenuis]
MSGSGTDLHLAWDIKQWCQDLSDDETGSDLGDFEHQELFDEDVDPAENIEHPVDEEISDENPLLTLFPPPRVGMEFLSSDAGHVYYAQYAYDQGFGVTKNGGSSKDGRKRVIVHCTKGGKPKISSKKAIAEKNKKVEKEQCQARINLNFDQSRNVWIITSFTEKHNHTLCPEHSHRIRSFRQIQEWAKKQLELNDRAGVSLTSNISAVTEMGGGPLHCGFSERDGRNLIARMRRGKFLKGDAEAMMQFFKESKQKDPNFYYSYKFDESNRLDVVFWADSTSQSWYQFFGDVVTFDATYIVNRFDLPVAPIVSVNHHGQSIIFGCAMMTREDADTYRWIITNWLDCMGGKAPQTIITDQSYAMTKAIAEMLPNTRHRHYNVWLADMFDQRRNWVPVYLNNHFWAGMRSTQRSESINSFLDRYVNSKTTLRNFVRCFDLALQRLRKRESDENYECLRGRSRLISQWNAIEKQFSEAYTNNMFIKFQHQIKALIDTKFTSCERLGNVKVYNIDDGEREFKVEFNCQDQTYSCQCHLFETLGLVCTHALLVYRQENVSLVPAKYIMDRWCKNFKRNYLNERAIAVSIRERLETQKNLNLLLYPIYQKLVDYAALDEETQHCVVDGLNGLLMSIAKVSERTQSVGQNSSDITADGGSASHSASGSVNEDTPVQDPLRRRKRGRPPQNRMKSIVEVKRDQAKKKRIKSQQSG